MNNCPVCGKLGGHWGPCPKSPASRLARKRVAAEGIAARHFPLDGSDPDTIIEARTRCVAAILDAWMMRQ